MPLGFYVYPLPHGTDYYAEDLATTKQVAGLFNYCQLLLGRITAAGWAFLLERYGVEELYRIDRQSGWYDEPTLVAAHCISLRDVEQVPSHYLRPYL